MNMAKPTGKLIGFFLMSCQILYFEVEEYKHFTQIIRRSENMD